MSLVGGSMQRLGEIHIARARGEALRLHSYFSSVFPAEWMERVEEDSSLHLLDFAYHARRVNNICGFDREKFESVKQLSVVISENDPGGWEENYQHALNRLVHATDFTFGSAHADHRQQFKNTKANLIPTYVRVATDKFGQATISPFGIAQCFLVEVLGLVRQRLPGWVF